MHFYYFKIAKEKQHKHNVGIHLHLIKSSSRDSAEKNRVFPSLSVCAAYFAAAARRPNDQLLQLGLQ